MEPDPGKFFQGPILPNFFRNVLLDSLKTAMSCVFIFLFKDIWYIIKDGI